MIASDVLNQLTNLVLLFFAYSFLGWCIEVTLKYIQFHRFINRGFFTGPVLPIYGSGAALITVAVGNVSRFESSYGTTFVLSFVLCGALEYFSSYFMEKRFHARWWDYSGKPMNLNGRIWIGNLVLFGLGGVAIVHVVNPVLFGAFSKFSLHAREIAAVSLAAVFAADYVMTHFVLKLVKAGIERSDADNTEAINKEIRVLLSDRSVFHKRFAEAYPEVIYRTERINARMEEIRIETEHLRREAEQRRSDMGQKLASGRKQLASSLETSGSIKSTIIEKQGDLLRLLYDEKTATDEMRRLMREIEADQERLDSRPVLSLKR